MFIYMHVCTYTHLYKHIYGGIPHPAFLRCQIVVVRTRGDGAMALIFTRQVTCQVKKNQQDGHYFTITIIFLHQIVVVRTCGDGTMTLIMIYN